MEYVKISIVGEFLPLKSSEGEKFFIVSPFRLIRFCIRFSLHIFNCCLFSSSANVITLFNLTDFPCDENTNSRRPISLILFVRTFCTSMHSCVRVLSTLEPNRTEHHQPQRRKKVTFLFIAFVSRPQNDVTSNGVQQRRQSHEEAWEKYCLWFFETTNEWALRVENVKWANESKRRSSGR